jgi:hypothetical protein
LTSRGCRGGWILDWIRFILCAHGGGGSGSIAFFTGNNSWHPLFSGHGRSQ